MIQGEKVRLRPFERGDLSATVRWFNDWEVQRFLDAFFYPLSMEDEERWFNSVQGRADYKLFAIEAEDGKLIGNVALHDIRLEYRHGALGIVIGEKEYWGRGYGTDAIRTLLKFAFENMNLHRVWLETIEFNERAIRCYEKCGFKPEGALRQHRYREGRYWDTVLMGVLRDEFLASDQKQDVEHWRRR